ncbi:hypothetical protein AW27_023245 [Streptomyces sp. PCS3-D2]|uniref:hypothetical protein n=1 Tax=Streptomyces sp. PCS3-D2 TaxID=1460244 RepID=UPI000B192954|nr:hypothetical protein [Streptomyces sp. PCS3-D2]WKV74161.1 hypothetical protein AW27_023245 [Streptomyces sp. PCS3-D2]
MALLTAFAATALGVHLNARATQRRDDQKAREELEAQADEFASAALAVRVTGYTNEYLWNGRTPVLKAAMMVGAQFAAGMLDPRRTGASATWEAAARSSVLIAYLDRDRNRAAADVTDSLKHALRVAMPLARHADPAVESTTDAVLDALIHHHSQAVLDQRLRAFRQAVREAAMPPSPTWRRVAQRIAALPAAGFQAARSRLRRTPAGP